MKPRRNRLLALGLCLYLLLSMLPLSAMAAPTADTEPPSLPRLPLAYTATENGIVWAWGTDTPRPAGAYGIAQLDSATGQWTVPDKNIISASPGVKALSTTMESLSQGTSYDVRFQSYADTLRSNPSDFSDIVTATTTNGDDPRVPSGGEPENARAAVGTTAVLDVKAVSNGSGSADGLAYQWFKLDTSSNSTYVKWKPFDGETEPRLEIPVTDSSLYNTFYRVEVYDITKPYTPMWCSDAVTIMPPDDVNAPTEKSSTRVNLVLDSKNVDSNDPAYRLMRSGDEFFCDFGDSFTLKVFANVDEDDNSDGCEGEFELVAKTMMNGTLQAGTTRREKTNGLGVGAFWYADSPEIQNDPITRAFWPGSGPRVFQLEITFTPDDQDLLPCKAYFFLNYGAVDYSLAKTHEFTFVTDGLLPGGNTLTVTRCMPLPDFNEAFKPEERVGYTFAGWVTDPNASTAALWKSSENAPLAFPGKTTLYSSWIPIDYHITYHLDGGTNHPDNPAIIHYDTQAVTLGAPARPGYTFQGWFADAAFTKPVERIDSGTTSDLTLYARWSLNQVDTESTITGRPGSYTADGVPHTKTTNSAAIPQTGDVSRPWAWTLLAVMALLGSAALLLVRKGGCKKRHK